MHGELAPVPATALQLKVEQEASTAAQCHAQTATQMLALAQVRQIYSVCTGLVRQLANFS